MTGTGEGAIRELSFAEAIREALDIALCVLSQVTSPRDLLAAGKVNHSFNRAVRENFLWQTVHAAPDSPSLRAFALSCHARAFFGRPP